MSAIGDRRILQQQSQAAIEALQNGNDEKLNNLLTKNPRLVNLQDIYGRTLLHYAARLGKTRCAELLLQHKADLSVKTKRGHTPLYTAKKAGSIAIVKLLVSVSPKDLVKGLKKMDPLQGMPTELLQIAAEYGQTMMPNPPLTIENRSLTPPRDDFDY